MVGECAITNGTLLWIDHSKSERRVVSNMTVNLEDVSFEKPIGLTLSALLDKKPISLEGKVGPVGKKPGEGNFPLDITVKALNQLEIKVKG